MTIETLFALLVGTLSTIFGGLILAFLFFLAREKIYPLPSVTGRWYVELRFRSTSIERFEGMILRYDAMLWREGNSIKGTAEQVYADAKTGVRKHVGTQRTRSVVEGHADRNIFSTNRVALHIVEDGPEREFTHFHSLIVRGKDRMTGNFSSTAADAEGNVTWQRTPF